MCKVSFWNWSKAPTAWFVAGRLLCKRPIWSNLFEFNQKKLPWLSEMELMIAIWFRKRMWESEFMEMKEWGLCKRLTLLLENSSASGSFCLSMEDKIISDYLIWSCTFSTRISSLLCLSSFSELFRAWAASPPLKLFISLFITWFLPPGPWSLRLLLIGTWIINLYKYFFELVKKRKQKRILCPIWQKDGVKDSQILSYWSIKIDF